MKDLKNLTLPQLQNVTAELGVKKFHAQYIFSFIHQKGVGEIDLITPVSKGLREKLIAGGWVISSINIVETFTDPDGTVKLLFELGDKNRIEAVLLDDAGRKTLCISTQVGCAVDCQFCATGKLGFTRNLTAAEIVDQFYQAEKAFGQISNVVYMGMGEPLLNYDSVLDSVRILNDAKGRDLGIRRITVSTSGITPGVQKLAHEDILPRLAVSLNAADNELRSQLMPINKRYPLAQLVDAVKVYQQVTRQRVTFEYILIKGKNDSDENARKLIRLIGDIKCNVNLIEFNSFGGCDFEASNTHRLKEFAATLQQGGIETVIRFKRGRKIKAACGQLGADYLKKQ